MEAIASSTRTIKTGSFRDVRLHADDRLDPGLCSGLHEVNNAVHDTVIGDGYGRLIVSNRRFYEFIHPRCPIEHRVLRVNVEVSELVRQLGPTNRTTRMGFDDTTKLRFVALFSSLLKRLSHEVERDPRNQPAKMPLPRYPWAERDNQID